jgi:beta-glucanase (GH16 family)
MNFKVKCFFVVFFIAVNVLFSQKKIPINKTSDTVIDSLEGYHLVWHDEFEGTTINSNNWKHRIGPYDYNGEVQYYTDRPENSYIENGKLVIVARNENFVGAEGTREFTSARIVTDDLAEWKYGKFVVRAKLPKGIGTWPAIWMMPTDQSVYGTWPNSGEIDIMEHVGHDQDKIHGTIHTKKYNHRAGTAKGNSIFVPGVSDDFHDYSVEWTEDFIKIFVDTTHYFTFENEYKTWEEWPFDQKFYFILNIAVGGGWGGQQGIDTSAFPVKMEIDYARVYQKTV